MVVRTRLVNGTKILSKQFLSRLLNGKYRQKRLSSDLSHLEKKGYGVIHSSLDELGRLLQSGPQAIYCGFDPTAPSLHVGNLLALIGLIHFQRLGHQPIALVGGATALIGDPTHRSVERERLEKNAAVDNARMIADTIATVFRNHRKYFWDDDGGESSGGNGGGKVTLKPPIIVNNEEWYSSTNVIDFLHETGRHFRMNALLGRSSVQARMESQDGMSLTEFVYQVFQSHDWLRLYQTHNCRIQLGGNDQTGNIMSGIHLIHKVLGYGEAPSNKADDKGDSDNNNDDGKNNNNNDNNPQEEKLFGITVPILTSETTGQKIGKSSGGHSLWLREELTSPFEMYQYFYNVWDSELERFLRQLTFLSETEISSSLSLDTSERPGQKLLAEKVVLLLHGERGLASALRCTNALFGASLDDLEKMSADEVAATFPGAGLLEMDSTDDDDRRGGGIDDGDDAKDVPSRKTKLTLTDLVLATKHCQRMILAKRPNFKPHVVENIAKNNAVKLIGEGAVKINFAKIRDEDFDDFTSCMLSHKAEENVGGREGGGGVTPSSTWSLLTVAKKHHYVVKWASTRKKS